MIIDYTIDYLIDNIKLISSVPSSQNLFSKEKFVKLANNQLFSKMVPYIMSFRSDYFMVEKEIELSSLEDGSFKIPSDAIGLKLKDIYIKNNKVEPLPYLSISEIKHSYRKGYYIKGDEVVIHRYNDIPSTNVLKVSYYRRPNYLVSSSSCGQVQSVIEGSNQVVLNLFPNYGVGTKLCCISSQAGFDTKYSDTPLLAIDGFVITLEDVSKIEVGDWICLDNTSPIPQIPVEAMPLFEQMIVIKIMEAMNDRHGLENAKADYEDMEKQVRMTLFPRVDDSYKKVLPAYYRGF